MPPERTAGNNEHGGRGAKTICNPMVWTGRRRVVKNRHLQALSPAGETVPSRRHNQTDSESGKEVTRLTPKRCWSRLLFFRPYFVCWRCSEVNHASAGRHFHKAIGWLMTRSAMSPGPKRISGRYSRRLKWATKSCSLSEN